MIAKTLALFALVAAAQAGGVYYDTHVGAQTEQNVRSLGLGGIQTLSTQSKAVDSAYSSVRRHETRVHNPTVQGYAAPAYSYAAAPAYSYAAAPAIARVAAPAISYAHAPTVVSAGPAIARVAAPAYSYAAAPAYSYAAAPVARVAAAPVASHGLLGVAYSAVPQVAHLSFDGFGVHYGY